MTWGGYLALSWYDRWAMHEELTERIEESNRSAEEDDDLPMRPKEWRR